MRKYIWWSVISFLRPLYKDNISVTEVYLIVCLYILPLSPKTTKAIDNKSEVNKGLNISWTTDLIWLLNTCPKIKNTIYNQTNNIVRKWPLDFLCLTWEVSGRILWYVHMHAHTYFYVCI